MVSEREDDHPGTEIPEREYGRVGVGDAPEDSTGSSEAGPSRSQSIAKKTSFFSNRLSTGSKASCRTTRSKLSGKSSVLSGKSSVLSGKSIVTHSWSFQKFSSRSSASNPTRPNSDDEPASSNHIRNLGSMSEAVSRFDSLRSTFTLPPATDQDHGSPVSPRKTYRAIYQLYHRTGGFDKVEDFDFSYLTKGEMDAWVGNRPHSKVQSCRWQLRKVMESVWAQMFVILVVLVDAVTTVMFSLNDTRSPAELEVSILLVLSSDIVLRIFVEGQDFYKGKGYCLNIFETNVVVICLVVYVLEDSSLMAGARGSYFVRMAGRLLRFIRSMTFASHQKQRIFRVAQRTAQHRVFDALVRLLGDLVRVQPENVRVDPVQGTFTLHCAEVRRETFEDLHLPVTVTGGFIQHLLISAPLQSGLVGNQKILIQVCNGLMLFGPVAIDWSYRSLRNSKDRIITLLSRRLDVFSPMLLKQEERNIAVSASDYQEGVSKKVAQFKKQFVSSILYRLLHDVTIVINNVSARYEDFVDPVPFACGVNLGSLRFAANRMEVPDEAEGHKAAGNGNARPNVNKAGRMGTRPRHGTRDVRLSSLLNGEMPHMQELLVEQIAMYWDTNPRTSFKELYDLSASRVFRHFVMSRLRERVKLIAISEIADIFLEREGRSELLKGPMFRERFDHHQYTVFPLNMLVHVMRRHDAPESEPPLEVNVEIQSINIAVDGRQMECFNRLVTTWQAWNLERKVLLSRPVQKLAQNTRASWMPMYGGTFSSYAFGDDLEEPDEIDKEAEHEFERRRRQTIRSWWCHAVRTLQLRLDLRPRTLAENLEEQLISSRKGEYFNVMFMDHFKDRLQESILERNRVRQLDMQVLLPTIEALRLRLMANYEVQLFYHRARLRIKTTRGNSFVGNLCYHVSRARRQFTRKTKNVYRCLIADGDDSDDEDVAKKITMKEIFEELQECDPGIQQNRLSRLHNTFCEYRRRATEGKNDGTGSSRVKPLRHRRSEGEGSSNSVTVSDFTTSSTELGSKKVSVDSLASAPSQQNTVTSPTQNWRHEYALQAMVRVESVHFFIMRHSFWSSVCAACRAKALARFDRQDCSPQSRTVSLQLYTQTVPRTMLMHLGFELLEGHLEVDIGCFVGERPADRSANISVRRIYMQDMHAPTQELQHCLYFDSFLHEGREVSALLQLKKRDPNLKFQYVGFIHWLRSSCWNGTLRVDGISGIWIEQSLQKLLRLLTCGSQVSHIVEEFIADVHKRSNRVRTTSQLNRAFGIIHRSWYGHFQLCVNFGGAQLKFIQPYMSTQLLVTSVVVAAMRCEIELGGDPPLLSFQMDCGTELPSIEGQTERLSGSLDFDRSQALQSWGLQVLTKAHQSTWDECDAEVAKERSGVGISSPEGFANGTTAQPRTEIVSEVVMHQKEEKQSSSLLCFCSERESSFEACSNPPPNVITVSPHEELEVSPAFSTWGLLPKRSLGTVVSSTPYEILLDSNVLPSTFIELISEPRSWLNVHIELVLASDLGLQMGNAAARPQDFNFLNTEKRKKSKALLARFEDSVFKFINDDSMPADTFTRSVTPEEVLAAMSYGFCDWYGGEVPQTASGSHLFIPVEKEPQLQRRQKRAQTMDRVKFVPR